MGVVAIIVCIVGFTFLKVFFFDRPDRLFGMWGPPDRRDMFEELPYDPYVGDDECAACGSVVVDLVEPGVYSCRECGHMGGSQYPEYARRKADERLVQGSPEQKLARARGLLEPGHGGGLSHREQLRLGFWPQTRAWR